MKKSKANRKSKTKKNSQKSQKKNRRGNFERPKFNTECPIHGNHKWGECRLNNRETNYNSWKPCHPQAQNNFQGNLRNQTTYHHNQANPQQPNHQKQQSYLADSANENNGPNPYQDIGTGRSSYFGGPAEAPPYGYIHVPRGLWKLQFRTFKALL